MHVEVVEGGQKRGPPETRASPGTLILSPLFPDSDGGDQDWKVADTECYAILDGA
jgi:hypothetical protein